jgi:ferritin-like metal-binding protein YciE
MTIETLRITRRRTHHMKLTTLTELLEDQLKDLYSAELQLTKALPMVASRASSDVLRRAILNHLKETEQHVERLDQVAGNLGVTLTGKRSRGMEGLIEGGSEVLALEGTGPVVDAALVAATQRVEHYEISAYGSARALAEQLGYEDVAELLQMTLDEESAADARLAMILRERILPSAGDGFALAKRRDYPLCAT